MKNVKGIVAAIVLGAGILLAQRFLAAEGATWLKRKGLWPQ